MAKMRRILWSALALVTVILLLVGSPARAGNTVGGIVQNAAVANGNGTVLTVFGTFLVASYTVSGTFSATVNFEGAGLDGIFQSLGCVPATGGASVSSTTTTGGWRCNIVGSILIRARVSGYVSGSVTVSLQASDTGSVLIGPPVDSASPSTVTVLLRQADPLIPQMGALWLSTTTANTLKYFEGTITRSLVDLSLTQSLSNKTLVAPTLSGTIVGTPTWATPIPAGSGGTGLSTSASTGTAHVLTGVWSITDLRAETYTNAGLPAAATAGRIALLTDTTRELMVDQGSQWYGPTGRVANVKRFGAIGDGATDDTTAINNAITAACSISVTVAKPGGIVEFPDGDYLVTSINATGLFGCTIRGIGQGTNTAAAVGTAIGVRLLPKTAGKNVLDLTGSYNINVERLQIGTTVTCAACAVPGVGILIAQIQGNAQSSLIYLRNVFITGKYSTAALYSVSVGDCAIYDTNIYNFQDAAVYTAVFSRDNPSSVTSDFQTIISSGFSGGRWTLVNTEIHEQGKATGASSGFALRIRGMGGWTMFAGIVAGSGSTNTILAEAAADATGVSNLTFNNVDFAADNGTAPAANFKTTVAIAGFTCLHCTSLVAAPSGFIGTGTYQASMGGAFTLSGRTTIGATVASNTTAYIGAGGNAATELGAANLSSIAFLAEALYVQADTAPTGTQTYIVTLEKNGADTVVTCTITGAATTCNSTTTYVQFGANDRYSWKLVTSATAAATSLFASVRANPY